MSKTPKENANTIKTIEFYEKVVAEDPNDFDAWNRLAIANMMASQRKLAIECWRRALEIKAAEPDVLNNLGTALFEEGILQEALIMYRKAVAISPGYTKAWQNLGELFFAQGKHDEAVEAFQHALSSGSKEVELQLLLAQTYYSLSRWDEVLDVLHNILQTNKENDVAWYNKACVHARLLQIEDSCKSLEKAIGISYQWRRKARLDSDFDQIRSSSCFQRVLNPNENL
ncbi:MAG: tetratricopeptide repeat protein [Candidatus Hodarchaeota archaeon]